MNRRNVISALICVCVLVLHFGIPRASAEYYVPPPAEQFFILADRWQIDLPGASPGRYSAKLKVDYAMRNFVWDVDLLRLADRIDSDSICTGRHVEKMRIYLQRLQKDHSGRPLAVQLVSLQTGGDLLVSGISPFDAEKSFARAPVDSLALYGLTTAAAEQVKSATALEAALRNLSERSWKSVAMRSTGQK